MNRRKRALVKTLLLNTLHTAAKDQVSINIAQNVYYTGATLHVTCTVPDNLKGHPKIFRQYENGDPQHFLDDGKLMPRHANDNWRLTVTGRKYELQKTNIERTERFQMSCGMNCLSCGHVRTDWIYVRRKYLD